MNDATPTALTRPRVEEPGISASGLLTLGIRAMGIFSSKGLAPCAIAIAAIAAFWGLPTK